MSKTGKGETKPTTVNNDNYEGCWTKSYPTSSTSFSALGQLAIVRVLILIVLLLFLLLLFSISLLSLLLLLLTYKYYCSNISLVVIGFVLVMDVKVCRIFKMFVIIVLMLTAIAIFAKISNLLLLTNYFIY